MKRLYRPFPYPQKLTTRKSWGIFYVQVFMISYRWQQKVDAYIATIRLSNVRRGRWNTVDECKRQILCMANDTRHLAGYAPATGNGIERMTGKNDIGIANGYGVGPGIIAIRIIALHLLGALLAQQLANALYRDYLQGKHNKKQYG